MHLRNDRSAGPSRGPYEVVVIGAGQAGLAVGYHLARQGRRFLILDRADAIAAAWRERWDSLTLFTPRRYDALPGMPFPGDPDGYPGRDEVVAYLRSYGAEFELPVRLDRRARALRRGGDGRFEIELDEESLTADQVVVATGPFQDPRVPGFASDLAAGVVHMHSAAYRAPADLPYGTIAVVGGGNTGFQIAEELAATRDVHLAIGGRQLPFPQRFLGRDLFWWLSKTRLIEQSVGTKFGKRMSQKDTLVGSKPSRSRKLGVTLHPRAVRASGRSIAFENGTRIDVDGVVWATGFRSDHSWIDLPITDGDGRVKHHRGVTDVAGLYFLGLQWQWTRGSALLGFVKDDAAYLAARISELAAAKTDTEPTTSRPDAERHAPAAALASQGD
jgi:putative flavoprotein involved in K+ transport